MPTPIVSVTRAIPSSGIDCLTRAGYDVRVWPHDRTMTHGELCDFVRGSDAIISLLTDRIDDEVLAAAGAQLRIVANYAVGFDNIELSAAHKRDIVVTNTPSLVMSESVAEHALALMFALAHHVVEADAFARAGKYHGWEPKLLLGTDVCGKTLGIVGTGRIGSALLKRASALGMHCLYTNRSAQEDLETRYHAERRTLETLLQEADFISIHVPLTPETKHLISTEAFSLMKRGAFLVNTSRGPVVDEKALLRALTTKRIAGAALDVFECEPALDCDTSDHMSLTALSNVILTPHTASATVEAREDMSFMAARNVIEVVAGRPPLNPVR